MSADSDRAHRDRPLTRILDEEGRPHDRCPVCSSMAILERSGRFPDAWIEQLADAVDLEKLAQELRIGGPNGLKRSGGSWVGECPACRGDAFNLTPKKRIWKCFKCDAGGAAIQLIQTAEQCDFPAAVRFLAKFTGTPIQYENERQRLRCSKAGCPASTEPLDEVAYIQATRQLNRSEAFLVWLQEAGIRRGESHSPSLTLPGRRKGRIHDVVNQTLAPRPAPPAETPPVVDPPAAEPAPAQPVTSLPGPEPSPEAPGVPVLTSPAEVPEKEETPQAMPPAAGSGPDPRVFLDESALPGAAMADFWMATRWTDDDATELWRRRGLCPHTGRVAGLRSNDRTNLEILKRMTARYPVDVLVEVGLWQRHEPDGPAWLQSESEAGVQVLNGARPSEFFYGKGQTGVIRRGRDKVPQYGWSRPPIIPYWRPEEPNREGEFINPKALVTEGEFKALAVWQTHGVTPARLAGLPDPRADRIAALRPHKHWPKGATPLPFLCPDGNLPLRVAALPGITFCRLKGGSWPVRYHLDAWLRSRGVREVMIAYDNDDRVSRWRCPQCGNTDIAVQQREQQDRERAGAGDLFQARPRGLRTTKPTCCGKPMKEAPNFKPDERDRWDAVLYAILLGQELEKLGLEARFMMLPDHMRDRETGKCDWDSALAAMIHHAHQDELPMPTAAPTAVPDDSEPDPDFAFTNDDTTP